MRRRTPAVLATVVCCAAAGLQTAAAPADRPSAQELWDTYPLHDRSGTADARTPPRGAAEPSATTGGGSATGAAGTADEGTPARDVAHPSTASVDRGAETADADDGGVSVGLLALIVALAAGAVASAWWWLRRSHSADADGSSADGAAPAPPMSHLLAGRLRLATAGAPAGGAEAMLTGSGPRASRRLAAGSEASGAGGGRETGSSADAPTPPDPGRRWTAEIAWRDGPAGPAFAAVARDEERGDETVLAQSPTLQWPPADAEAVKALAAAADDLTRALLRAGWTPLARGDAWYARRFAWTPADQSEAPAPVPRPPARPRPRPERPAPPELRLAPEQPSPPEPASADAATQPEAVDDELTDAPGRGWFKRRPWPEDTEHLWRCELRWNAGWARSRLEAIAQEPHGGRRTPLAVSEAFTWMLHADPDPEDPEIHDAVDELRELLLEDGWTEVEPGRRWYAHRFVWHRDGDPPRHDRDPAGADAEGEP